MIHKNMKDNYGKLTDLVLYNTHYFHTYSTKRAQIEMKELRAENERLKTDRSESTPEQSVNYARGTQLNTLPQALVVTPDLTTQEGIQKEMYRLADLFKKF